MMIESFITIDPEAITRNFLWIREWVWPAHVWAVVKGDAYGFGLETVASALSRAGADRFVVWGASEVGRLRKEGLLGEILCLTAFDLQHLDLLLALDADLAVGTDDQLERIASRARATRRPARLHLDIDTGLGRSGWLPSQVPAVVRWIEGEEWLRLRGAWSHLVDASDVHRSRSQLEDFRWATEGLPSGIEHHLANSGGLMLGRDFFLDGVRPGLALYGMQHNTNVRLCFSWKSRIISVVRRPCGFRVGYGRGIPLSRESLLGLVPVGFSDGYPRLQRGVVGIHGSLAPILGPVAMNAMLLDLTDMPETSPGDEVILLGDGGPSLETLLERSEPAVIPNLFACVQTLSTVRRYTPQGEEAPVE